MEVRVYSNFKAMTENKAALIKRVEDSNDILFPYDAVIRTFKALYGQSCVIKFIIL